MVGNKTFLFVILMLLWLGSTAYKNSCPVFSFKLINRQDISVASCSALEKSADGFLAFGDNVPFVYRLSNSFIEKEKKELISNYALINGVMSKQEKLDIEAACYVKINGKHELFAFPSGSTDTRNRGFRIFEDTVIAVDFSLLFDAIRSKTAIQPDQLNIEGAATTEKHLVLANRGTNHLILIPIDDFEKFIHHGEFDGVNMQCVQLELDQQESCFLGVSGLVYDEKSTYFYFTASQEATQDWYKDGEVFGSVIGRFKMKNQHIHSLNYSFVEDSMKQRLKVKLESLVIMNDTNLQLIAVSDSDGGKSEAFYFHIEH